VVGDAERLPFDASAFDRVLLSLVLHQLTDPGAAVAEAFRVLPGGGRVLARTIAPAQDGGGGRRADAPARRRARRRRSG